MSTHSDDGSRSWLDSFGWQIPLAILLFTLLTTNALQLVGLLEQHSRLAPGAKEIERPEVRSQLIQAEMYGQKLKALFDELNTLSANDPTAKKIVDDFRSQLSGRR